jgi:hypothetical protein
MSFVRGGLPLQAERIYNLEDNVGRPDLTPDDVAALMHVAMLGYNDCVEGHRLQLADRFTGFHIALEQKLGADTIPGQRVEAQ